MSDFDGFSCRYAACVDQYQEYRSLSITDFAFIDPALRHFIDNPRRKDCCELINVMKGDKRPRLAAYMAYSSVDFYLALIQAYIAS